MTDHSAPLAVPIIDQVRQKYAAKEIDRDDAVAQIQAAWHFGLTEGRAADLLDHPRSLAERVHRRRRGTTTPQPRRLSRISRNDGTR